MDVNVNRNRTRRPGSEMSGSVNCSLQTTDSNVVHSFIKFS
jgi:hypothetical protein